jgi:hypothetical protein
MAMGIKICKLIHKIYSPRMWLNQSGYINSSMNFERTWTITNKCKWKHNMWTSLILTCIQSPTLLLRFKWNFSSCQHHFISRSIFCFLLSYLHMLQIILTKSYFCTLGWIFIGNPFFICMVMSIAYIGLKIQHKMWSGLVALLLPTSF